MNALDYIIIGLYLIGILSLGFFLRNQSSDEDYFLGGKQMGWFPLALSTMATQLSAISFISAPAFVGLREGGGLQWLTYEFAVPLAMIAVLFVIMPSFYRCGVISIYDFLEQRFDLSTRILVSILFQVVRAFSTGIMIYATAIILESVVSIPFWQSVLVIGLITMIYSLQGGMKAVVYGDAIQMVLIILGLILCGYFAIAEIGGFSAFFEKVEPARLQAIKVSSYGFSNDGFGLIPMIFGGFVLYVSYYGCDQTQAQRTLSAKNYFDIRKLLVANGFLRFPITLLYCFVGLAIGVLAKSSPEFLAKIPPNRPDYMMPLYILEYLPHGIIGLLLVALLAAAMSSLSSALNSLAAVSLKDLETLGIKPKSPNGELAWARWTAFFWGIVTLIFSAFAGNIAPTVIEAINKVGSALYGPILAVFLIGILSKRTQGLAVIVGMISGLAINLNLWIFAPQVFWMWWNVIGLVVTWTIAILWQKFQKTIDRASYKFTAIKQQDLDEVIARPNANRTIGLLTIYFVIILLVSFSLSFLTNS